MHVVIVDEELPYPPNSGKRIRTLNLTLCLAKRHRITYLCHRNTDSEEARRAQDFFQSHRIETVLVNRTLPSKAGLGFYGRLLVNLLSPLPYSVQVHNSVELRRAIQHYAASHDVHLWHCEWTPYAESLSGVTDAPWVVMAHNIESLIWRRYYETEQNLVKRWYIKQQWRKFERFERRVFSEATNTIAVSEEDAALAREQFNAHRVKVVENGVDISHFRPDTTVRKTNRILFLGSLDWRPNLDGVKLLLDRVFPDILTQEPSAYLSIVGRRPPKWLVRRVERYENVELHADVPDVRPYLRRCGVMTVPLRIGGGSRLKILESLATECPVVSTKIGAEGLCLTPGKHFVQVGGIEGMAEAIIQCIRNPQPVAEMARLGRRAVVDRYDWAVLSEKLETIWREETSGRENCPEGT